MSVKKQHWSSRLQVVWALEYTRQGGVDHEFWLFRTKAGALRAMTERMRKGMQAYGTPAPVRAELERLLAAGEDNEAATVWWELYEEEYHIEDYEVED